MSRDDDLAEEAPFRIDRVDDARVIVRFAEYVDHRRTRNWEEQLEKALREYRKIACDVRHSETIDSDWLTLLEELSLEARDAGKRFVLVGLSETLRKSADIVGLTHLEHSRTLEGVWK